MDGYSEQWPSYVFAISMCRVPSPRSDPENEDRRCSRTSGPVTENAFRRPVTFHEWPRPSSTKVGRVPITHRILSANRIRHHVAEQGDGPVVLLLHGWPEGWYSWRHQLGALANAGYHAVAPDLRGYGQTDAPADVSQYRMREMVADAVGLIDALGAKDAVVVGHDWGAAIAWQCAVLQPQRFRAVASLSIPFTPRAPAAPTAIFRRRFEGQFFYILYFQEPGVAEAELDADPRRSLRLIYYAASGDAPPAPGFAGKPAGAKLLDGMIDPPELPAWLTEQDLDVYATDFAKAGFRGGLNRYRNMDRDWEETAELAGARVAIPALFIVGAKDLGLALKSDAVETTKKHVDDLRGAIVLPGIGHWIQQEGPAQTNEALLAFLRSL
jgi:pimeloyl-ACP methyl ester carboxylesterase